MRLLRDRPTPKIDAAFCLKVACCLFLMQVIACDTTAEAQSGNDPQRPLVWTRASGTTFALFPSGDVYAVYAADPHRPTNALTEMVYSQGRIENTRSPRVGLAAGGRFGVLRIDPGTAGGRSWQVSISAGLDVVFGVMATTTLRARFARSQKYNAWIFREEQASNRLPPPCHRIERDIGRRNTSA